jgi:diguanylate cyclase (GGDEF)-like protein
MPVSERPSLRRVSGFSVFWYFSVVVGWLLLATSLLVVASSSLDKAGAPLVMTAVLLVVLELLPLVQGRGHDPQGVVMSTAFVCAILLMWGIWPAVLVVSIAALASDLNVGKQYWKILFNAGQYNVSVAAGWLVMVAAGHTPTLEHPLAGFAGHDLVWVVGVWIAYFATNDILVSGALAWRESFLAILFNDFWHYAAMTFAVLALSPVVVILAQSAWILMPLLLIPLLLVYRTAQLSLEMEHQAGHDSLTGLPNRTNLLRSLNEVLARSRRDGLSFGLLLIDLDHFKEVNDTLGHHVGDQILIHFAGRLTGSVRESDLVARLGGDEFAVILPEADLDTVRLIANRIRSSLADPMALDGMLFDIEASIGMSMHPEHGERPADLLRLADVAMYDAKETRSGIATYSAQRDRNSADRLGLLGELRQALDDDALELHYQPKLSLRDGRLLGVEALIRWDHPMRGFVAPDEFIPLAERSGIMPQLTERVVSLALSQMAEWRHEQFNVQVAINVSVTDLAGGRLPSLVSDGLRAHGLPAGMLQLEITERVVAQEPDELNLVLQELAELGVTLSLDDFGTGYSSLLRLQSLPVDEIKIDRAFVSRLSAQDSAPGIVQAVIDLAHALGVPAIAEGVETEQEWTTLRALGCDGAQGWHIAAPMTPAAMTDWIRRHLHSGAASNVFTGRATA